MAGRPREFDRHEALKQARDLFWTHGYEATSMADLVEALGLASARIYAAFGSKEALFRESIELYEREEGGFAGHLLGQESTADQAIRQMLHAAVDLYTRPGRPQGCMVVSAATNCSPQNKTIREWLAEHRRRQTASIIGRLQQAASVGELVDGSDVEALGDSFAALLHGISIQARDGIPPGRLHALVEASMRMLTAAVAVS